MKINLSDNQILILGIAIIIIIFVLFSGKRKEGLNLNVHELCANCPKGACQCTFVGTQWPYAPSCWCDPSLSAPTNFGVEGASPCM